MEIVNFKHSTIGKNELAMFFESNDYLFVDPFSKHVSITDYITKLIDFAEIFVAVEDDTILGFAGAYMNDFIDYTSHLQVILVAKRYQCMKIGKRLVEEVINASRNTGMKYCSLTVDLENSKAIGLYKSLGFKETTKKPDNDKKMYMMATIQ